MTVELFDQATEDAEELVVAWLTPLRRSAVARQTGDPLPFTLVTHAIPGTEDEQLGIAEHIVSVHTLCAKALGWLAAKNEAKRTHLRMLELGRYLETITLSDGRLAGVDYCRVFQPAVWVEFDDTTILRKVGRYRLGLSYMPVV